MSKVLGLVIAMSLVSSLATADEPPLDDPRAAIAARGIQLKVGKRGHVLIVVPPAEPAKNAPNSVFTHAHVYFGDDKTLYRQPVSQVDVHSEHEWVALEDRRSVKIMVLKKIGAAYKLSCSMSNAERGSGYGELGKATPARLAKTTVIKEELPGREAYLLARAPGSTTYYYVDRRRGADEGLRLFIGKQGAMKQVTIKEMARDTASDVFVTSAGTLTITKSKDSNERTVMFGDTPLSVLSTYDNRFLIHGALGVYAREPSGLVCDAL